MKQPIIITLLCQPETIKQYTPKQWNLVLQQGRTSGLLLKLLDLLQTEQLTEYVPDKIITALKNERYRVQHQAAQTKYEINLLNKSFAKRNITPIYLKGAAYVLAGIPVAQQRTFSDIDILLSKKEIEHMERLLKCEGFSSEKTDDYDQMYYRLYMHEIPPMVHVSRGTVIDIHHNILPVCHEHPLNIDLMKEHITEVSNDEISQCQIFAPNAMFIHASVHLFNESEFDKGLRDLTDLASMYIDFSNKDPLFDEKVIELATTTELTKAIYYSYAYISKILNVRLSDTAHEYVDTCRTNSRFANLYDFIFTRVLIPYHESCDSWSIRFAKFLAYWRGHLLRMPLKLLIPHLFKKSVMQVRDSLKKDNEEAKTRPNL